MTGMAESLLKVSNVETYYGPIMAIRGVSFDVPKGGIVVELGAGHGLLSALFAMSGKASALAVDKRYDASTPAGIRTLLKFRPYLAAYVRWQAAVLSPDAKLEPVAAILGIHSCGDLTDYALREAVRQRANVGVMPCCHGIKATGTERVCAEYLDFSTWGVGGETAIDIGRAWWLREQGYRVHVGKVQEGVTGQPRILTGRYERRAGSVKEQL